MRPANPTRRQLLAILPLALALPFASRAATPTKSWAAPGWEVLRLLEGKVILVDFWTSTSAPTRHTFPWMNQQQELHADNGLVVIAVNRDEDRALAEAFLKKFPPKFQVEYDPDGAIARQFDVHVMPTSFLIDRKGRIRERYEGFQLGKRPEREKMIKLLVDEPAFDAPAKKKAKPR